MSELSAEQIAKAKWPDARISSYGHLTGFVHVVTNDKGPIRYKSKPCLTEKAAWEEAAERAKKGKVQ